MKRPEMMFALALVAATAAFGAEKAAVQSAMEKVNARWQSAHPLSGEWKGGAYDEESPFWPKAAYHAGNMAAARVAHNDEWTAYSRKWAEGAKWQGAKGVDKAAWRSDYGEKPEFVLFGDWQACFQIYQELGGNIDRAMEVFDHESSLERDDFIWWADGIFMVAPSITHIAKAKRDKREAYLKKLSDCWKYAKDLMLDDETGLFFRDGRFVYPKHQTASGKKDFWARGNGWVVAALARAMDDLEAMRDSDAAKALKADFLATWKKLMSAVIAAQTPEGYWTRSMLDAEQAPGPETSGTAFFAYALAWGLNRDLLKESDARGALEKAWDYLLKTAVQEDGALGYVQPIGDRALPGQKIGARSEADFGVGAFLLAASEYLNDAGRIARKEWVALAEKLARPVLEPMAEGKLHSVYNRRAGTLEVSPIWDRRPDQVAYMELFGRLMAGIAPWLALPDDDTEESKLRAELRALALKAYAQAVDPNSPDRLGWDMGGQTLVDAAYIAESFFRAWDALWVPLDDETKKRYIEAFRGLRRFMPPYQNWVLFCSMEECLLLKAGSDVDDYRLRTGLYKVEEWYVGDGWYADGQTFAFDYYNSFVIHPMYFECVEELVKARHFIIGYVAGRKRDAQDRIWDVRARMQRYALILERFISPEGTFPVFGRSMTYRMATMQPLAMLAWRKDLPGEISEGQVRAGLDAVRKNMFSDDRNFGKGGYLTLGFNGSQPWISDRYTNNGSLYMTSLFLLPLGLPATDSFWTAPDDPWTAKKAWGGKPFLRDHKWGVNAHLLQQD